MLRERCRSPELMDAPDLGEDDHEAALRGLARVNRASGSGAAMWAAIRAVRPPGDTVRMLDVACGGGDVAMDVARRAAVDGVVVHVTGCDVSATALACAERAARSGEHPPGSSVQWLRIDALRDPLPEGNDVVTCSLFLHHLDDEDVVLLLRRMAGAAGRALVVDDLRRSPLGWLLAWAGTRALTRSAIVHVDGPLSVEGAFTRGELWKLAARAGLTGMRVRPRWPERMMLTWVRDA